MKLKTGRDLKINSFCYLKAVFSAEPPEDSDFLSFIQFTMCMSQNRLQLTTSFFVTFHVCRKSKFVANMCSDIHELIQLLLNLSSNLLTWASDLVVVGI